MMSEELVTLHRGHGRLTAAAGEPTPNGYRLEIVCPCGVTFERWVTEQDAIDDLLREHLRAERNETGALDALRLTPYSPAVPPARSVEVSCESQPSSAATSGGGVTVRLVACAIVALTLLGLMLTRPSALLRLPSLVVDLIIGLLVVLPLVAIRAWKSRKE